MFCLVLIWFQTVCKGYWQTTKAVASTIIIKSLPGSDIFNQCLSAAGIRSCPKVIKKKNSCSTQLSMKFQLLIKTEILINKEVSCVKSLRYCIYHDNKC